MKNSFSEFIGRHVNGMTFKEVLEFKKSKKYWQMRFAFDNSAMGEPLAELTKFEREDARHAWSEMQRMGEVDEAFMELVLLEQLLVPPTYTEVIFCANCGHVPSKPTPFATTSTCSWCQTGAFNRNEDGTY